MNDAHGINVLWLLGGLVLAISALSVRRTSIGVLVRSLVSWAAIAGIAWVAIAHRDQVEQVVNEVAERFGIGQQTVDGETVRITMAPDGHFWARASINGVPKRLLVDSGATITALSPATARAAGVTTSKTAMPVVLTTANGRIGASRGTVKLLELGTLATRDLGVVVSPAFGDVDVLGMNFLSRLGSWRVEGSTLILEPKPRGKSQ